jgi:hypothetical protein
VVSFSITKRQRDFTSVHQVLATNYQIICDPALSGQAQQVLAGAGGLRQTAGSFGPQGGAGGFGGPSAGGPGAGYGGQPGGSSHPGPAGHAPGQSGPAAPPQGSPYGGDATRHEPSSPASRPSTSGGLRDEHGRPRYGTNEGPRYGETPETSPASAPEGGAVPDSSPSSEPPRYGERSGE